MTKYVTTFGEYHRYKCDCQQGDDCNCETYTVQHPEPPKEKGHWSLHSTAISNGIMAWTWVDNQADIVAAYEEMQNALMNSIMPKNKLEMLETAIEKAWS